MHKPCVHAAAAAAAVCQVHKLSSLAESDASWGQPVWKPDGSGVVAAAWPHKALNVPNTLSAAAAAVAVMFQVRKLSGLAESDASWGQPVWTPDGSGVVAVAWPHKALNFPHTSAAAAAAVLQVDKLSGLAEPDASWGQPVWTPDGCGIAAEAWPH
jgi:hypothetical protein